LIAIVRWPVSGAVSRAANIQSGWRQAEYLCSFSQFHKYFINTYLIYLTVYGEKSLSCTLKFKKVVEHRVDLFAVLSYTVLKYI